MMGYRSNSQMLILSEEWAVDGASGTSAETARIDAQHIGLALCDANGNDENLGAWLAQDFLNAGGASGVTRKFLASTGAARHVLLHEFDADADPQAAIVDAGSSEWSSQVADYLSWPAGGSIMARRVWPAC